MNISDFIKAAKNRNGPVIGPIPMKDGSELSIQASKCHYCTPRTDEGPWTAFEVCCQGRFKTANMINNSEVAFDDYVMVGYARNEWLIDEINARGGMRAVITFTK